jgi:hypothetical protein
MGIIAALSRLCGLLAMTSLVIAKRGATKQSHSSQLKIATPQDIHPHPNPLPSREREIKEVGFKRRGSQ